MLRRSVAVGLPPGLITTMDELLANPVGAIWVRPSDYQAAVRGSVIDGSTQTARRIYRRDCAREDWIEATIIKHRIIGE